MGSWGTGLYSNDMSDDVKDEYLSKLKAGKSDEETLTEILQCYKEEMADDDDKYDIWFALADTMWKKGRLTNEVKSKALALIKEERLSNRFEDEKSRKARNKVLEKLEVQLNSKMPERKKVPVHQPFITKWKPREVYLYQIKNPPEGKEEFEDWWVVIYVSRLAEMELVVRGIVDIIPCVYLKMSKEKPQDPLQINSLPFIVWSIEWRTGQGAFEKALVDTSHRSYPKEIEFLGVCENFQYPVLEIKREDFQLWRSFKEDAIIEYERELKRIEHNQLLERATGLQLEERISFLQVHNSLPIKRGENHTKKMSDHYPMKNPYRNRWWIGDRFEYTIEQPPEGKEQYKGWKIYLYVYELRGMELVMPGEMEQVPFVYVKLIEDGDVRDFADFVPFVCFSINEKSGKGQYLRPFVDALDSWLPKGMKQSGKIFLRYLPDNEDLELCKADVLHIDNLVLDVIKGYEREITRLGLEKVNNTAEMIRTIIEKNGETR